jgi:hypothetical protein
MPNLHRCSGLFDQGPVIAGRLVQIPLLGGPEPRAALLSGKHDEDPLFDWDLRNAWRKEGGRPNALTAKG